MNRYSCHCTITVYDAGLGSNTKSRPSFTLEAEDKNQAHHRALAKANDMCKNHFSYIKGIYIDRIEQIGQGDIVMKKELLDFLEKAILEVAVMPEDMIDVDSKYPKLEDLDILGDVFIEFGEAIKDNDIEEIKEIIKRMEKVQDEDRAIDEIKKNILNDMFDDEI